MRTWTVIAGVLAFGLAAAARADEPPEGEAPPPAVVAPPPVVVQPPAPVVTAPPPIVVNTSPARQTEVVYAPRVGLVVGGLSLSAAAYLTSVIYNGVENETCGQGNGHFGDALGCRTNTWPLYVPFAGPFIQLGYMDGAHQGAGKALLVVDGVVQVGGLAMAITGFALSAVPSKVSYTMDTKLHVSPFAGATSAGLSAFKRF